MIRFLLSTMNPPRSRRRRALALLLVAALVAPLSEPRDSLAQERPPSIGELSDTLRNNADYKVRAGAAFALGAVPSSDAPQAVPPLCTGISDREEFVRRASTAALKRLRNRDGLPCLKARRSIEKDEPTALDMTRAIEAIEGSSEKPKYYVAYKITNDTGRADATDVASTAVQSKLAETPALLLAPRGEAAAAARAVISQQSLKGYSLAITYSKITYEDNGDGLMAVCKARVAIAGYPGNDLRASLSPSTVRVSASGRDDRNAENEGLKVLSQRIVETFSKNASQFQ